MDFEYWLGLAERSIMNKVEVNQRFEVKSLFDGVEWEALSKGERIMLGKEFSNAVRDGRFPMIIRIQKADNNHARYIKVGEE